MESLRSIRNQCGAGLMTVASPACKRSVPSAVNVHGRLEKGGKHCFLRTNLPLAFFDGRDRFSCIRKLGSFGEPSTKWASRTISITLITARSSRILMDHELLKLSSPANVLSKLVPRDLSFTAILKLMV